MEDDGGPRPRRNQVADAEFAELAKTPQEPLSRDLISAPFNGSGVNPIRYRQPNPAGTVRALFIGINYEGQPVELDGCQNDVLMCHEALRENNFPIEEACFLVDHAGFPHRTGQPTHDSMIQHFKWLVHGTKPGDTLFLHYSGHGAQRACAKGDEEDGLDETLVPYDYKTRGTIVDDDVYRLLVAPLKPGVRLTAVFDCCHSGSMMDLPFQFRDNGMLTPTTQHHPGLQLPDVLLFSGCRDDQTSADVSNVVAFGNRNVEGRGKAGGANTNSFVFTLNDKRNATSYLKFITEMRAVLQRKKFQQIPQMSSSQQFNLNQPFSLMGRLGNPVSGGGLGAQAGAGSFSNPVSGGGLGGGGSAAPQYPFRPSPGNQGQGYPHNPFGHPQGQQSPYTYRPPGQQGQQQGGMMGQQQGMNWGMPQMGMMGMGMGMGMNWGMPSGPMQMGVPGMGMGMMPL